MKLRPFFFWFHLTLGLTAGLLIFWFSLTGFLLAFEPQIINEAEATYQKVTVPTTSSNRLSLKELATKAGEGGDGSSVTGLTVYADPARSILVQLGPKAVYINPYSGQLIGSGSNGVRAFFEEMTAMHRWFGANGSVRETAKTIKGIVTCFFGLSLLTGLYLWWPRQWTAAVFKVIGLPQSRFSGKQFDFNWHNAIGFWSAPWLLIIVITGLVMIYPRVNDLLYRAMGSEPPVRPALGDKGSGTTMNPQTNEMKKGRKEQHAHHIQGASFDTFFEAAVKQDPQWISINLRLPQGNRPNVMAVIEDPSSPNAYGRSLLTLDAQTGAMLKWEPYGGYSLGRKARIWVRALHTGEAGGLVGELIAALAVLAAMVLVFTGFRLASRRFFKVP